MVAFINFERNFLKMKNKKTVIIIAIVAVIAIIGGALMSSYNGLVTGREAVDSAESNIDTYLQRRADLVIVSR